MSTYIIIRKHEVLNVKPESEKKKKNDKLLAYISLDFIAFIEISLRKTAMFWITENHFLFVGLFIKIWTFLHWQNPKLVNLLLLHP